jgi:hypothetical protein
MHLRRLVAQAPGIRVVAPKIFSKIIALFSINAKLSITSHEPNRKWQMTVRFTGHSRIVCRQYVILLMPRIWKWLLEFWKTFEPVSEILYI